MRRQYSTFPFANAIRNFRQAILSICYCEKHTNKKKRKKKKYAGRAPTHTTICVKIPTSFISSIADKTNTPNPTYYNPKNPSNGT